MVKKAKPKVKPKAKLKVKPKKKPKAKEKIEEKPEKLGKEVGKITHFFDRVSVAVVEVSAGFKVGDNIRVKGATTDFKQKISSMQIEKKKIEKSKKGDAIGLKVKDKVRPGDRVYLAK